ncbi:MAG: aconitate hydratase AcnA [Alphaproteobacteria bacterium]|nr:aconitate hydratase AcnA [Alphaproteobacteria bacterium]OJV47534.1 MAG: aconitate hydratase 1 [Alphaproteobacteria bacterium 43-37]
MSNDQRFRKQLTVNGQTYEYYSLGAAQEAGLGEFTKLPKSLKVLIENLLRYSAERPQSLNDIQVLSSRQNAEHEISFMPARVLMQDFTGVPAVVDLAAMRDAVAKEGRDPSLVNPLAAVDLVIDHSVMVDYFASDSSFKENVRLEYERNRERYTFLRWGQQAFKNFRVVPPGTGICHQVNLEYLAQVVWTDDSSETPLAYPDTLVGTDSHTTMINGLSVLGWGVGGIEAEAVMLGQPLTMLIPPVVGFKLSGSLKEGATATDLVLTVTQMLRAKGVVGKFVEFYGDGLEVLSLADRATIANMAPEYGATCGFFPIDDETLAYLRLSGRDEQRIALVEAYAKTQGLWRDKSSSEDMSFDDVLSLDISTVEPCLAGPKRPQDKILLSTTASSFKNDVLSAETSPETKIPVFQMNADLKHGDIVIAAITSCTNTSNPSVMIGAGLIAQKAVQKGLRIKPWVKTSLAPGSQVVTDYLVKANVQKDLDALGFNLVGYGCTTCIGNSGPLPGPIAEAVTKGDLNVCAVLSGNRNFEGRVNPHVKSNYLASPMLVVAYAIAGNMLVDLTKDPLGTDQSGNPVYLKDIWPTKAEIDQAINACLSPQMFKRRYEAAFKGDSLWQEIDVPASQTYGWESQSTYVKLPPYFMDEMKATQLNGDIYGARPLAILGDSITTDHISPAGSIKKDGPAGKYLLERQVAVEDFNSYGARRGNHEVMIRGTFANIRLKNEMLPSASGGYTSLMPQGTQMSIFDAAQEYLKQNTPLVIIAGKEYGTGSSRDWAAKGTRLLGVKAVIAESFERIHRSNLVGMGVLPLMFPDGVNRLTLGLKGDETIDLIGLSTLSPKMTVSATIHYADGKQTTLSLLCRIDTADEILYFQSGGILPFVAQKLMAKS